MEPILIGVTDRTIPIFIPDPASTDGSGKTGLVAANLTVSYTRVETDNDVVVTDVTSSLNDLSALTDAHNDWGLKEVSSTLAPGLYRLDVADAVFASGAWYAVVYVEITTSAAAATPKAFQLVAYNPLDGVRLGLTSLPNAAAGANGGLPLGDASGRVDLGKWLGTAAATPTVAGVPEVDITHMNGLTAPVNRLIDFMWSGAAVTGTLSTTQATTDITGEGDNAFNNRWQIMWQTGAQAPQSAIVTDYDSATGMFTFAPPLTGAPANGDTFLLIAAASGLAVGDRTGALSGSVGSVTADVGITQTGADKVWASAARTLTSFGTLVADVATSVWGAATRLLTAGTNIVLAKGVGVTGFNDLSAAQVNSEVDTALSDIHLDHLLAVEYDPQSKPGDPGALLNELVESDDVSPARARFTAGALEEAPTGGSAPTVGQIADAVWDEATAGHTTGGTFGEQAKTDIDAILADTNELQTDWVNGGRLDVILDARSSQTSVDDLPTNAELTTALTNLDATVSSRATPAQVNTEADTALSDYGALKPTVAGRTLDVNAGGEAGLDLDNTSGTLAKGTDITGFNDLSAAQVNAEADTALADVGVTSVVTGRIDAAVTTRASQASVDVIDDLLDTEIAAIKAVTDQFTAAQAEPAAVPAANATPLAKIAWLAALARNRVLQTATQQTLRNDANSADIATAAVSDDGTTFERSEWV